eukprot:GFUD01128213.1.p1 GENE.GFUD01128213.1~~GFUD01128213.1.p1  ORF type:complete len:190 (+),score=51.40 GFUD01128213.1:115-684(+)
MTRTELVPSSYGYSNVLALLETLAKCGTCELSHSSNTGVRVAINEMGSSGEVDLSMLDRPWAETGKFPVGAVEGEDLEEQQVVGVRRGTDLPVQITEVASLDTVRVCLLPVEERDRMTEDLDHFYTKREGRWWVVPDAEYCWPDRLMAAPYKSEDYYRVMVKVWCWRATWSMPSVETNILWTASTSARL